MGEPSLGKSPEKGRDLLLERGSSTLKRGSSPFSRRGEKGFHRYSIKGGRGLSFQLEWEGKELRLPLKGKKVGPRFQKRRGEGWEIFLSL